MDSPCRGRSRRARLRRFRRPPRTAASSGPSGHETSFRCPRPVRPDERWGVTDDGEQAKSGAEPGRQFAEALLHRVPGDLRRDQRTDADGRRDQPDRESDDDDDSDVHRIDAVGCDDRQQDWPEDDDRGVALHDGAVGQQQVDEEEDHERIGGPARERAAGPSCPWTALTAGHPTYRLRMLGKNSWARGERV